MYLHIEALSCSPHPTLKGVGGWREKIVLEILEIMGLSINSCREKQQVTEWKVS